MVKSESIQIANGMYSYIKKACELGYNVRIGNYYIWRHEDGYSFCPVGEHCSPVAYENLIDAVIEMLKQDFDENQKPKGIEKVMCVIKTAWFHIVSALTGGNVVKISFDDVIAGMEHKKKLMILQGEV